MGCLRENIVKFKLCCFTAIQNATGNLSAFVIPGFLEKQSTGVERSRMLFFWSKLSQAVHRIRCVFDCLQMELFGVDIHCAIGPHPSLRPHDKRPCVLLCVSYRGEKRSKTIPKEYQYAGFVTKILSDESRRAYSTCCQTKDHFVVPIALLTNIPFE